MVTCDRTSVQKKRILIATPQALATTYDVPATAFDGTASVGGVTHDLLRIYPLPQGYRRRQRTRQDKGVQFHYERASFTPFRPWQDLELEITAVVSAATLRLLQAVHEIHATSGLNGGATSLVTLFDYCRPDLTEWASALAGDTEPVTIRQGAIDLEELGSVAGRATGPWSETEPVKIVFKQVNL
jgi:hypothetical protein